MSESFELRDEHGTFHTETYETIAELQGKLRRLLRERKRAGGEVGKDPESLIKHDAYTNIEREIDETIGLAAVRLGLPSKPDEGYVRLFRGVCLWRGGMQMTGDHWTKSPSFALDYMGLTRRGDMVCADISKTELKDVHAGNFQALGKVERVTLVLRRNNIPKRLIDYMPSLLALGEWIVAKHDDYGKRMREGR